MITKQPISAKVGEVSFRQELANQHFGDQNTFSQELNSSEMWRVVLEKMDRTRQDFQHLKKQNLLVFPFLEIGAGYGQAALLLANEFNGVGYASDLAIDPLQKINLLAQNLHYNKLPNLIIFDAEAIPFPDNSFHLIFCYQTLHHFPHPKRVCQEVVRVLKPGGTFFFAEEPVAQTLNLSLWRRPTKLRWWEKALKATLILPFISRIGKTEVDHGILEQAFTLRQWQEALSVFETVDATLKPFPFGPSGKLLKQASKWRQNTSIDNLNQLFLFFLGGGINAVCQKKGKLLPNTKLPIPRTNGLKRASRNNIQIILPKDLFQKLYPKLA